MSGNLNILPHKSWNVYNKKNRDKVAKDEADYAEELKRETERLALVNAELRRTKLLARRNVTATNGTSTGDDVPPVDARVTLTDAFREPPPIAAATTTTTTNRSQLLDRPSYLSDVNNVPTPFYLQSDRGTDVPDAATLQARADAASRQAQSLRTPAHIAATVIQESQAQISRLQRLQAERERADPMAALLVKRERPLAQVTPAGPTNADADSGSESDSSGSDSRRKRRRHKSSKHHHHHHKHKSRRRSNSSDGGSSLAQLRSERLAREQESRQRVQSLIVSERLSAATVNQTATRR
jgi:hypothetical protein